MSSLIFLQKIIRGCISTEILLSKIVFAVPRPKSKNAFAFYYGTPFKRHHFNSALLSCSRLGNSIVDSALNIFNVDLNSTTIKIELATKLDRIYFHIY